MQRLERRVRRRCRVSCLFDLSSVGILRFKQLTARLEHGPHARKVRHLGEKPVGHHVHFGAVVVHDCLSAAASVQAEPREHVGGV